MNYNFQIMTKKGDKYIPDMELLKKNASCIEEIEYLDKVEERWKEYKDAGRDEFVGFAFNMCYVMRQACGHFEIFQHHVHNEEEALKWLEIMEKDAMTRKCTRCTCGWGNL